MAFWNTLERFGERTALITETGEHIAYNALLARADEIAGAAGSRCLAFLMCRNCADAAAGYVGFLRRGIVPVLLAENLDTSMLEGLLESYRPAYFYLPSEKASELSGAMVWRGESYTLLRLPYEQDYKLPEELALLLTTSGSTGSPKLVRQSGRNIEANTRSIAEYLGILSEDRAITTLPMQYTYGLSILQSHLSVGAAVILTDKTLMDKEFWALLKEQKATTFGGVPYIYEMLKKLRFDRMNLPSLRYLTQAGGKLPKELAEEFIQTCKRKNMKFIVMYGQTEATARMAYLPWEHAESHAASIGIAIPGGEFWLADPEGAPILEPETTGELVYRGPNVTLGYAENRFDLCKPDENHGELRTGDMAKRDAKGFYYIVGRKKRFLKLFGSRVNLDEVEGLLNRAGIPCACAGVDDRLDVYITDGSLLGQAERFIKEHTAINPNGFQLHVIEEIPRNDSGKVLYSALGARP
ncbi:AMP-binding protein [Acutalibacter sp.]|uniref:AMP-binding protein n=1 Tax=Acutalibacter sp. TaxID=1918636 RepID=UPI00216F8871|nr:AMP-binding protein [Acutalibacter sp.]